MISDLHGNWPALTTALADAEERGVERFGCLGDVVGYGAKPRECLERVMALIGSSPGSNSGPNSGPGVGPKPGVLAPGARLGLQPGFCLQGNHEQALMQSAAEFNPNARAAIEWTREELSSGADRERNLALWDFLDTLRPLHSEPGAMYAHGSPRDPVREYMLPRDIRDAAKMRANFARMTEPVCFVGHSHVPAIYYEDGTFYRPKSTEGPYDLAIDAKRRAIVNVGSVGQPRDGDPRLCYALFDGRHVTFVRLEYDVAAAQRDIRAQSALPAYLADRLSVGH
ncbi:MAG: metallophosphoesterase family protein [Planctomycetes bacterium]|nr:metallophosphoesterase family protein [Planctomycetota bacterium]